MQSAGKKSIFLRVYKHYNRSFLQESKFGPGYFHPRTSRNCYLSLQHPNWMLHLPGWLDKNQISDISFYFEGGMVMRD